MRPRSGSAILTTTTTTTTTKRLGSQVAGAPRALFQCTVLCFVASPLLRVLQYGMGPRLCHVGNKQSFAVLVIDPLHNLVLGLALEILLCKWRRKGFPIGSILALYRLYERELRLESSFKIWWDVWLIFDGPERVVFLQGLSLVDPEFTWDMLGAWYCMVACCTSSLEEMD